MLFTNAPIEVKIAGLIVLLIAMGVHEFAHNYVAYLMGDNTPKELGRLTLNPLVHIYWPGWLMFAVIGFGPLGYALINERRMRNPRWGYLAAVAAGPLSNLLLAAIFAIFIRIVGLATLFDLPLFIRALLIQMVTWNVLLFVFNLLPLFPIDGWRMMLAVLPSDLAYEWQKHRDTTQLIFFGLLLLSFLPGFPIDVFGVLIGEPSGAITDFLIGL